jgi:hypothetical protein
LMTISAETVAETIIPAATEAAINDGFLNISYPLLELLTNDLRLNPRNELFIHHIQDSS